MDNQKNYYNPVSDRAFADIKVGAIEIWNEYENEYGYRDEKLAKVNSLGNVGDNAMFIIAMFDDVNIHRLLARLQDSTLKELLDGRLPDMYVGHAKLLLEKGE